MDRQIPVAADGSEVATTAVEQGPAVANACDATVHGGETGREFATETGAYDSA